MNRIRPLTTALRWLLETLLPPILLFGLVVVIWRFFVLRYQLKPYLLPGPDLVFQAILENAWKLVGATMYTAAAASCGLFFSLLVGLLIAFVFSQSRWIRSSSYPYALFVQTVPVVAIAPLIVHWCGRGFPSVVLTSFIIGLFPIIANGTTGLLQVDPDLVDLFRLNNATRWQILRSLRLPNAVPAVCTGAKTSCGLAVVGAVVGEFFAGYGGEQFGLGYLILLTTDQLRMAELFAAVVASTLLSVTMFAVTSGVTHAIMQRWYNDPSAAVG